MPWAGNLLPGPPAAWIDPSFCWRKSRTNLDRLDPSCDTMRTEWAAFEPKSLFSRTEVETAAETEMEVLSLYRTLLHLWPGMKSLLWALPPFHSLSKIIHKMAIRANRKYSLKESNLKLFMLLIPQKKNCWNKPSFITAACII
jgi:hypothetical protein